MKIRVFDFRIDKRSHSLNDAYRGLTMYVPTEDCAQQMIGWLQEYDVEPYSYQNALEVFIRTSIMYQREIDFKSQFVADKTVVAADDNQKFVADIIDTTYPTYRKVLVRLLLPDELILDLDNCIVAGCQYDDEIDLTIYNLLLYALPITFESIESK